MASLCLRENEQQMPLQMEVKGVTSLASHEVPTFQKIAIRGTER